MLLMSKSTISLAIFNRCLNHPRVLIIVVIILTTSILLLFWLKYDQTIISQCFWNSIGWFKGKITGNSHMSWENLWFPVDFPLRQPIEKHILTTVPRSWLHQLLGRPHNPPWLPWPSRFDGCPSDRYVSEPYPYELEAPFSLVGGFKPSEKY